jgi:hypothetical protein
MRLLQPVAVVVGAVVQTRPLALRVVLVAARHQMRVALLLEQELQDREITAALVAAVAVARRLAAGAVLALLAGLQPVY